LSGRQKGSIGMGSTRSIADRVERVDNRSTCAQHLCNIGCPRPEILERRVVLAKEFEEHRQSSTILVRDRGLCAKRKQVRMEGCMNSITTAWGAGRANQSFCISKRAFRGFAGRLKSRLHYRST